MWLYVSGGFLSIVAHRDKPEHLLVRARHPDHIGELFPDADITIMPSADYPFRVVLNRMIVQRAVGRYVMQMDYDNFKNSVTDDGYHDACVSVWNTMFLYGENHRQGGL
ncbi:MAG: hypothetical protein GWO84_07685 [Euryarchaeota archaeon]|nr:hypothetical protein [Euryarchaeota archaeon]